MLVISRREVEALLDPKGLIEAVAAAHAQLTEGLASVPPRVASYVAEHQGLLGVMPAYLPGVLSAKLVTLFPNNEPPLDTHQAAIVVFDERTGAHVALMDGTAITAARTAAASAIATRYMSREDARVLTIVGTGVQARSHARIVTLVRDFEQVRITGRDQKRLEAAAEELGVQPFATIEEAAYEADVICLTTHSSSPVLTKEHVAPGTHINSVGYNTAGPELDPELLRGAQLVVEWRSAAFAPPPAGLHDLIQAVELGILTEDDVHADLGELVLGIRPGRMGSEAVSVYRSAGSAVQDAAAASLVLAAAREHGIGSTIDL